jgi:hypothetical protein
MPAAARTRPGLPTADIGVPDLYYEYQGFTDWWENTADLIWPASMITYGRMRHDPQLKAVLMAYMLPIMRATWVIDPDGARDEVVQAVADDLGVNILGADERPGTARRRGVIWLRHLRQALYNKLTYGYMPFERRYRIDDTGMARLDNLGPRMPWTIAMIDVNRDGTLNQVWQNTQRDPLPANRLVWYTNDLQGGDWTGVSDLRACFGAWLLKHETWRVHATSIRRFGMGIPSVEAPPGATQTQVMQAQQLATQMRAGDHAGIGLPQGFKPGLMGMTGSVPDALGFIEYLDRVMAKQALAALIELGQTETGSRALGDTFMDLFLMSLQAVADDTALIATSGVPGCPGIITDLVDQNWGEDEPAPRLVCTDVGTQYEATAAAVQQLTATGALQPDASLDEWIRKQWHLPVRTAPWIQPQPKSAPQPAHPPGGGGASPGGASPGSPPASPPGQGGTPDSPGPGSPSAAGTPSAAASRSTGAAPQLPPVLRRQPSAVEARSGFNPEDHQRAWETALGTLMSAWQQVTATLKTDIVDQVAAALAGGNVAQLAAITVDAAPGAAVLVQSMTSAWHAAAQAMTAEAASQGVTIDPAKVKMPPLSQIASGRASLAASYLAQQAGSRAMRSVQPAVPAAKQAEAAALDVAGFLDDLSTRNLRDQLGGALTAAQNAGRVAVLEAAPASAGQAVYTASEILDGNVCDRCRTEDGHEFGSLAEANAAYPTGGYINCQGELRCRGTVVAVWGGTQAGSRPKAGAS